MKISEWRLLVEKFDECFAFYSETMGFEVTWGKPGDVYASFKVGEGVMLSIFAAKLMEEHLGAVDAERRRLYDPSVMVFEAENVDEVYKDLISRNVAVLNEPQDMPGWGIRCMHLRDPEGNLLEINTMLPKENWSKDLVENEPV